jgi:phenylalanyl-tRNA synthetase alpha chain
MLEQFEKIGKDALAQLEKATDLKQLEDFRIKYLGRKGLITDMLSRIGNLSADVKPQAGQLANKIKKEIAGAFERAKKTLLDKQ